MKMLYSILVTLIACTSAYAQDATLYTCPMHPHYISERDGVCPICGMGLVPAKGDSIMSQRPGVAVAPEIVQTMGIRTAPAIVRSFGRTVRAFGHVAENKRLERVVASRVEGWIEGLTITAEGDSVSTGSILYTVYSPDLIAAQRDYLAAATSGSASRLSSAARRLRSLGMQESVIAILKQNGRLIERMPVYAEGDGVVSMLTIREGEYIKPGDEIVRIQRYDEVWILASVAEQDLAQLVPGLAVDLILPDRSNEPIQSTIDYIYPTIDVNTRTGQVRIIIPNADGSLRPGAYADVSFTLMDQDRLAVPTEAVLRDSRGTHVVIAEGEGRFAPRSVVTGLSASGYTEVLSGLVAGENIVISGQFLLDSEASLAEGFNKMRPVQSVLVFDLETPLSELPIDAEALTLIDHFVDASLYIHASLIDGNTIEPDILSAALAAGNELQSRFTNSTLAPVLEEASAALISAQQANNRIELRTALAGLMASLEPWLVDGAPVHYSDLNLTLYREDSSNRLWIQEAGEIRNPYGASLAQGIDWPDPMTMSDQKNQSTHDHDELENN